MHATSNSPVRLLTLPAEEIDLQSLKQAGLVPQLRFVRKVILSGEFPQGGAQRVGATVGAKAAIEGRWLGRQ